MRAWPVWACASLMGLGVACGPSEVPLGMPDAPPQNQPDAFVLNRLDAPVFDARPPDAPRADARPLVDAAPGSADASVTPDAPIVTPDAPPPPIDASSGPTVTFDTAEAFVGAGGTATIHVVLSAPAGADTAVSLGAATANATVPTSVVIAQGDTSAAVLVTGVSLGDVTVTASPGGATVLVHVVPPVSHIDVDVQNILPGDTATFTVTLASAPALDVPIEIDVDDPTLVRTDTPLVFPHGQTTATFPGQGLALGVTHVGAFLGNQGWVILERVDGVFLSEILYNPVGDDTVPSSEWVEVYNATGDTVTLDGFTIQVASPGADFVAADTLSGTIASGGCLVVQPAAFDPLLGNATDNGDGIRLVTAGGGVIDEVIYGPDNSDGIANWNDDPQADPDVDDAGDGNSIEQVMSGGGGRFWQTQMTPSPGVCANLMP